MLIWSTLDFFSRGIYRINPNDHVIYAPIHSLFFTWPPTSSTHGAKSNLSRMTAADQPNQVKCAYNMCICIMCVCACICIYLYMLTAIYVYATPKWLSPGIGAVHKNSENAWVPSIIISIYMELFVSMHNYECTNMDISMPTADCSMLFCLVLTSMILAYIGMLLYMYITHDSVCVCESFVPTI